MRKFVIGFDIICANILKEAKFYAILADEFSSHNVKHLAVFDLELCLVRYEKNFISFINMEWVRAADIKQAITGLLTHLSLSLDDLRGQGYDGASTMSGEKSVQRIIDKQPKALYTHCLCHFFNLVIAQACEWLSFRK